MKKKHKQRRQICNSWYHQKWFRILLVIVAVDMIVLGGALVVGLDIIGFIQNLHFIWRIIGGTAYIIVALFIIHYSLSYRELQRTTYMVCQHCAYKKED